MKTIILCAILFCIAGCSGKAQQQEVQKGQEVFEEQDSVIFKKYATASENIIAFETNESIKKAPIIRDLVDLYNAYALLYSTWSEFELWYVINMAVHHETAIINSTFSNKNLEELAIQYHEHIVSCIPNDKDLLPKDESDPVDRNLRLYDAMEAYKSFRLALDSIYQTDTGVPQFTSPAIKKSQFDNQCLFTIDKARHFDFSDSSEGELLIMELEDLMNSGQYSSHLYQVWKMWRIIMQVNEYKLSRSAPIPHWVHNEMRMKCAITILQHLIEEQNNEEATKDALYQFMMLASSDNLYRIHPYEPDENQITWELYTLGFFMKE